MDKKTARKMLDALERVDHLGFGGARGLTAGGDDRVALHGLAVSVREGLLKEAREYITRDNDDVLAEVVSWLQSRIELGELLRTVQS